MAIRNPKSSQYKKRVAPAEVPAVQELLDLQAEIDSLMGEHSAVFLEKEKIRREAELKIKEVEASRPDVFAPLHDLVERYNAQRSQAEEAVKALGVSCGPFEIHSVSVDWDAQAVYDELGAEMFFEVGGGKQLVEKLVIDRQELERNIASGAIPAECVEEMRKVKRSYKRVPPLTL